VRTFQPTYRDRTGAIRRAAKWYCELRNAAGVLRRVPAFADRAASEALGRQLVRLVNVRAGGDRPDPALTRWLEELPDRLQALLARQGFHDGRQSAGMKPPADHLADFDAYLAARGDGAGHIKKTCGCVQRTITGCGFTFWTDLSASKVMAYLNGLRADRVVCKRKALRRLRGVKRTGPDAWIAFCPVCQASPDGRPPRLAVTAGESGLAVSCGGGCDPAAVYAAMNCIRSLGATSFNHHLTAFKSFARWMVKDNRAGESPVAFLDGLNARTDRRRERRALSIGEIRRLLTVTRGGPDRAGMTGVERSTIYRLAVESGLRFSELRSLTRAGFSLNGPEPTVTVEAGYSKHRRRDVLPLRPDTAATLRTFLAGKMPAAPAFAMPNRDRMIRAFKADLATAGIAYRDDAGRVVDVHALRHTAGTLLAASGVHPKVAQSLMRHSSIDLTMSRYSHVLVGQESDAGDALPDLGAPPSEILAAPVGQDRPAETDSAREGKNCLALCLALRGGKR